MEKKEKQRVEWGTELSLPSSADLRGRQSVRATFKLTEMAINVVNIISTHLGIKQKSLFDHLIDDTQSLDVIAKEQPELVVFSRHASHPGEPRVDAALRRRPRAGLHTPGSPGAAAVPRWTRGKIR